MKVRCPHCGHEFYVRVHTPRPSHPMRSRPRPKRQDVHTKLYNLVWEPERWTRLTQRWGK